MISMDFIELLMFNSWNLFFNNNESDDFLLVEREKHAKIIGYYENTVPRYSLSDFKSHLRVTKEIFELLIIKLGPNLLQRTEYQKIMPSKQIAIALWIFSNQEVYRTVADRFGLSKDTQQNEFLNLSNFPGVVGAIDGSHIPISAPKIHTNSYVNRKKFHSILLQGICDANLRFIDVFVGLCGRDSAYPLSNYLLTPYRDNGHLNDMQHNYNTKLSKTRVVIERAFGMLKGRFRKLKFVYVKNTEMIPLLVLACCVLHNFCIDNDDIYDFDNYEGIIVDDSGDYVNVFGNGNEKRDVIANLL
ncbi:putative nuclease HARBI1 [Prorops nasuta]|uniref:putative nuclease HARBI1 n=1 Tax=Prorops nasuta TaxID=863751 RepID=UPI0034CF4B8D